MSSPGETWDVFVSYERSQEPLARRVVARLRDEALTVFFDLEALTGSRSLDRDLDLAVRNARAGVVIARGGWGNSGWAIGEYEILLQRWQAEGIPLAVVVPFGDEPHQPPEGLPLLVVDDTETSLDALVAAIRLPRPKPNLAVPAHDLVQRMEDSASEGRDAEAADLARDIVSRATNSAPTERLTVLRRVLAPLLRVSDDDVCRRLLTEAWELAQALGVPRADLAHDMVVVLGRSSDPDEPTWLERAAELAKSEGDDDLLDRVAVQHAIYAMRLGDAATCVTHLEPLVRRWTPGDDPSSSMVVLLLLGSALRLLGRAEEARERLEELRFRARACRDRTSEAAAVFELGALVDDESPLVAIALYQESAALCRAATDDVGLARSLAQESVTRWRLGEQKEAHSLLEQARSIRAGTPYVAWAEKWVMPCDPVQSVQGTTASGAGPERSTPALPTSEDVMTEPPQHDLFFSYRTDQAERALPVLDALAGAGISLWRDLTHIRRGDSITDGVRAGLQGSRALIVFATHDWPKSPLCAAELVLAWTAAERLHVGDHESSDEPRRNPAARRVLLLKPHGLRTLNHLRFGPLADCRAFALPAPSDPALATVAQQIKTHLDALDARTFADAGPGPDPAWIPRSAPTSNRFVGRDRELWELHAKLTRSRFVAVTGHQLRDTTQLRGLGGLGKTLLASHYAHTFAASWPGGIFWIQADPTWALEPESEQDLQSRTNSLLDRLAEPLHVTPVPGDLRATAAAVREAIATRTAGKPYLWVIDNLPPGTSQPVLEALAPPTPDGALLVTTRYMSLDAAGERLDLTVLDPEAALTLLTSRRTPSTPEETTAARDLAQDVGYHPLALDVLAALVRLDTSLAPYAHWRARIADPGDTAFDTRADALKDQLPTGCQRSITRVLETSLGALDSDLSVDILRLAALVADAPIPVRFLVEVIAKARAASADAIEPALDDLLSHALGCRDDDTQTITVHSLVQWVAERWNLDQERLDQLASTATSTLHAVYSDDPWGDLLDIRTHDPRIPFAPHALQLSILESTAAAGLSHQLAIFFEVRGDFATARLLSERALAAFERILGPEHPDTLNSLQNLAVTLNAMGDLQGAHYRQERVLAAFEHILDPEHPWSLGTIQNHAGTLYAMGDFQRARSRQEHVLAAFERILGPEHPNTLTSLQNLALILRAMGDLQGARSREERVLAAFERILGPEHPDTLTSLQNLAVTLKAMGDFQCARSREERALSARERILGPEHPDTLTSLQNLAVTLTAMGDLPGARSRYERALAGRERILGSEHSDTCVTRYNLILTLLQCDPPAANDHFTALLPLLALPPEQLSADQQRIVSALRSPSAPLTRTESHSSASAPRTQTSRRRRRPRRNTPESL